MTGWLLAGGLRRWQGIALALPCAFAQAQTAAQHQGQEPIAGIYTCTDNRGRKLTSDRPIPECLDREQKVLNPSGTVRARVAPNPTVDERAAQEARERQLAAQRAAEAEEKRRERALLARYPNREAHDRERVAAFAHVAAVAQTARKRILDLQVERHKLDLEMEFYQKDPTKAPPALRHQLEENTNAQQAQHRFIIEQESELKRISVRFDEELERLVPLWNAQGTGRAARPATPPRLP